jgi:glycosyltransferase involved in cell wall biosynthesis
MIYYSHRTRKALAEGRQFLPHGFAHYSYGTVCRKFLDIFEHASLPVQELTMPEIYASPKHVFPPAPSGTPLLHIAFKPYEEIRLLKGAVNVAHVAWEFDKLPRLDDLPNDHPRRFNVLNDYVHMLNLVDEVWVGCTYTQRVFESHGVKNVQVVPAPIAVTGTGRTLPRPPSLAFHRIGALRLTQANVAMYTERGEPSMLDTGTLLHAEECNLAGGRVFLSILNPGDPRKNAAALILGFQEFLHRSQRNDLLVIKLVLDGTKGSLRRALSEHLPKYFDQIGVPFAFVDCPNILLVRDHLPAEELAMLYRAADFYVCTSGAEGQGLPVQEAMAAGLVPISTRETAMEDYIDEKNSVVMQAETAPIPYQVSTAYGLWGVTWRQVGAHEVARALAASVALSPDAYAARSEAAVERIRTLYGYEPTTARVKQRIAAFVS